jgi:hypothetical protein
MVNKIFFKLVLYYKYWGGLDKRDRGSIPSDSAFSRLLYGSLGF